MGTHEHIGCSCMFVLLVYLGDILFIVLYGRDLEGSSMSVFGDMQSTSMMHPDGSMAQHSTKTKHRRITITGMDPVCQCKILSRDSRWNYSWPCMHAAAEARHKHCGCCTSALSCLPLMNAQKEYSYIKHTSICMHMSPYDAYYACMPHSLRPAYLQLLLCQ